MKRGGKNKIGKERIGGQWKRMKRREREKKKE